MRLIKKIFLILASAMLFGCLWVGQGFDPVNAAKASGQIQSFLQEHPNAKIVAVLLSDVDVKERLKDYPECSSIKPQALYFVSFDDAQAKAVAFISDVEKKTLCVVVQGKGATVTTPLSTTQAAPAGEKEVQKETQASVAGETLVEFKDERKGFRVLKPQSWKAEIVEDSYLLVSEDENTDVLVWPIQLQGEYQKMTGVGLGNYLIGLIKQKFPDFAIISMHVAPDNSSMQVLASLTTEDGVKGRIAFTTFVETGGRGLLTGYGAPENKFEEKEPLLRKIVASFAPISTQQTRAEVTPPPAVQQVETLQLVPFTAGDGAFRMKAPSGWRIDSLGSCSTKSMAGQDPTNGIRRIFAVSASTLVIQLQQGTAEEVLTNGLPVISDYVTTYSKPSNIQVTNREPYPDVQGLPGLVDSAILTGTMDIDGTKAKGKFGIATYSPGSSALTQSVLGTAFYYIIFSGLITEESQYATLEPTLAASLKSWELDSTYTQNCISAGQADISRRSGEISRTLSETSDVISSGYKYRSEVQDRLSEKWSDTILGYDRVYNPDKNEVYHVPNGFYDKYDINRQKFEYSNMRQLQPNEWNNYAPLNGELHIR